MLTVAYALYTVSQLALAVWGIALWRRRPSAGALTMVLPIAALVYDNAIVMLGALIGEGELLRTLTYPRFLGHAFLTPIWIVTAVAFAGRAGVEWAQRPWARRGSWALYGLMAALGIADALVLLDLQVRQQAELVYYTNVGGLPGPPLPAIVMVLVTVVCGAFVLARSRWPWMLAGAVFMLVTAAIPVELVGFVVSNSGEVVLALALVLTERFLQGREAPGT